MCFSPRISHHPSHLFFFIFIIRTATGGKIICIIFIFKQNIRMYRILAPAFIETTDVICSCRSCSFCYDSRLCS